MHSDRGSVWSQSGKDHDLTIPISSLISPLTSLFFSSLGFFLPLCLMNLKSYSQSTWPKGSWGNNKYTLGQVAKAAAASQWGVQSVLVDSRECTKQPCLPLTTLLTPLCLSGISWTTAENLKQTHVSQQVIKVGNNLSISKPQLSRQNNTHLNLKDHRAKWECGHRKPGREAFVKTKTKPTLRVVLYYTCSKPKYQIQLWFYWF